MTCLALFGGLEVVLVLPVEDGAADVRVVVEAVVRRRRRGRRRRPLRRRRRLRSADSFSGHNAQGGDGARNGGLSNSYHCTSDYGDCLQDSLALHQHELW